jgi:hypothetical protein
MDLKKCGGTNKKTIFDIKTKKIYIKLNNGECINTS